VDEIRENPLLSRELINHRVTNGKHRAILTNRRHWRAATASRKGARSLSVDIAMLDELREHTTWDAWNAIVPTTTVRTYSQVVCTSNAGDQRSEVLRALRDGAMRRVLTGETENTRTGYFEWSVPMEADPRDPAYWYMANPAMGMLNDFTIDDLRGYLEAMEIRNLPGFQTEHLCQWVDSIEPGIIPAEHWAETLDHTSKRADDAPIYAALDVNYERSRSFVAIAARRADGNLHIEIAQAARGTDWVVDWLSERKDKFAGVAIQKTGAPASGLIDELARAGVKVFPWGPGQEVAKGCADFYDMVVEHRVNHRPAALLDRAANSGVARNVGDAWVFDRRNSPVDVSPLIACVAAAWLANEPPVTPPEVHLWPDEDTIREWEQQGEDLWNEVQNE
jgi:phage terminase large subunit-like protein